MYMYTYVTGLPWHGKGTNGFSASYSRNSGSNRYLGLYTVQYTCTMYAVFNTMGVSLMLNHIHLN